MYEQLDGILTCPDLRCAGSAEVRQPWVPLHRAPKRPRYLNLGLMYLNLDPPLADRSLVPRDVQEASRADFGAISDPSGRPWKPKNTVKYNVFAVFHVAPQTSSRSSKSAPWKAQNDPQEAPRSGPGRPRSGQAPRAPEASQERPQSRPKTASERPWRPSWAQLAQKSRPKVLHRPFLTPRGPVLHPPGVDFFTVFFSRKA